MLFKLNTSNSSFSELTAQLRDFTSQKNQNFKTKLKNNKFLEKSKQFLKSIYTKTFKRSKFQYEKLPEMTVPEIDIFKFREEHPNIEEVVRSIILARTNEGASMDEIKSKLFWCPRFMN